MIKSIQLKLGVVAVLSFMAAADVCAAEDNNNPLFSVNDVIRMVSERIESDGYDIGRYDHSYTIVCFPSASRTWTVSFSRFIDQDVLNSLVFEIRDGIKEVNVSRLSRDYAAGGEKTEGEKEQGSHDSLGCERKKKNSQSAGPSRR